MVSSNQFFVVIAVFSPDVISAEAIRRARATSATINIIMGIPRPFWESSNSSSLSFDPSSWLTEDASVVLDWEAFNGGQVWENLGAESLPEVVILQDSSIVLVGLFKCGKVIGTKPIVLDKNRQCRSKKLGANKRTSTAALGGRGDCIMVLPAEHVVG